MIIEGREARDVSRVTKMKCAPETARFPPSHKTWSFVYGETPYRSRTSRVLKRLRISLGKSAKPHESFKRFAPLYIPEQSPSNDCGELMF
jgi:hypothetical protein